MAVHLCELFPSVWRACRNAGEPIWGAPVEFDVPLRPTERGVVQRFRVWPVSRDDPLPLYVPAPAEIYDPARMIRLLQSALDSSARHGRQAGYPYQQEQANIVGALFNDIDHIAQFTSSLYPRSPRGVRDVWF